MNETDGPVPRRNALLVANGLYTSPDLPTLRSPALDCAGLAAVLRDPVIGRFEVGQLIDAGSYDVRKSVEEFFQQCRRDDLLLLHFSGHGLRDETGALHFAAGDTMPGLLGSTSLSADFLRAQMDRCRARSIVVLLDCCYSGAFIPGIKDDGSVPVEQLAGHGTVVITATDRMTRAHEGEHRDDSVEISPFTRAIIEGLRSGAVEKDGRVTTTGLYDYVFERLLHEGVPHKPRLWGEVESTVTLASHPRKKPERKRRASAPKGTAPSAASPEPAMVRTIPTGSCSSQQPISVGAFLVVRDGFRLHVLDPRTSRRLAMLQTAFRTMPSFLGGNAYFPALGSGTLVEWDLQSGRRRWDSRIRVRDGSIGISSDRLYVVDRDDHVHALVPADRSNRWTCSLAGREIVSAPRAADGLVLLLHRARPGVDSERQSGVRLDVFRETDGAAVWTHRSADPLTVHWTVSDSTVYLVVAPDPSTSRLEALDLRTGDVRWISDAVSPATAPPAAAGGTVGLLTESGQVHVFGCLTGERLWSTAPGSRVRVAPVVTEEYVVCGDEANRLFTRDSRTGEVTFKRLKGRLTMMPAVADGTLYTADRSGTLTAFRSGRRIWTHDLLTPDAPQAAPIVMNKIMHVTDTGGTVHSIPLR